MPREEYEHFLDPKVQQHWQSLIHGEPAHRDIAQLGGFATDSIAGDIRKEVGRVMECAGEDVIVVDLTKPEFGIPVVRVIIPE